jgi:2'-5' RNA ligase
MPWRLFIAVELPEQIRRKIGEHVDRLRQEIPDTRASWTRAQNIHLTLKFLGDTPVERAEALSTALQVAASRVPAFEIEIGGCGSFPTLRKPNVLWIGIDDLSSGLQKFHQALETECEGRGFPRDQRSFHPHLTIARLRHSQDARRLGELHQSRGFQSMAVKVNDACLIRSELSPEGSRYTVIARHQLQE